MDRLTCSGGLNVMAADIGGQMTLDGASLVGGVDSEGLVTGIALAADGVAVKGGVFCDVKEGHRFRSKGEIRFLGAQIGSQMSFNGALLEGATNSQGVTVSDALSADGAVIKDGFFCNATNDHRFETKGQIRLLNIEIGGQLSFKGAKIQGATDTTGCFADTCLGADGSVIKGGVFCDMWGAQRFESVGAIRLVRAEIGRQFSLTGAKLLGAIDHDGKVVSEAVSADGVIVRGGMFLNPSAEHRCEVRGELRLLGAEIEGQLSLKGARLQTDQGDALLGERIRVALGTFLDNDFEADGAINLSGAHLNDIFLGGTFRAHGPAKRALDLSDAEMGRFRLREVGIGGVGRVMLEGAKADTLDCLDLRRWGPRPTQDQGLELDLDGFTYRRAEVCVDKPNQRARRWAQFLGRDAIAENVLDLIDRGFRAEAPKRQHYTPQPFEQAARALREAGYDHSANEVAVAKREFKRACQAEGLLTALMSGMSVILFRHGYGPLRAAAWTIAFVLLGAWAFAAIDEGGGLVIADPQKDSGAVVDMSLPEGNCLLIPEPAFSGCAKAVHKALSDGLNTIERPIEWSFDALLGVPKPRPASVSGTRAAAMCPEHPVAYSLDTLLPLVDFGVEKRCRVADDYPRRGLAETFRIAFAIFGWLFIPLVALTFAGVLRKD